MIIDSLILALASKGIFILNYEAFELGLIILSLGAVIDKPVRIIPVAGAWLAVYIVGTMLRTALLGW